MLLRLVALLAYPAHLLNRALAGPLGEDRPRRVPGALVVGLALLALTASTAGATVAAFDTRPEPQLVTIADVVDGHLVSGLWIEFDAELVEGPHRATIEVSSGGGTRTKSSASTTWSPIRPPRIGRSSFDSPSSFRSSRRPAARSTWTARSRRTRFACGAWSREWGIAERYPELTFSDSRLIAYGFSAPWQEPSWLGTVILGASPR